MCLRGERKQKWRKSGSDGYIPPNTFDSRTYPGSWRQGGSPTSSPLLPFKLNIFEKLQYSYFKAKCSNSSNLESLSQGFQNSSWLFLANSTAIQPCFRAIKTHRQCCRKSMKKAGLGPLTKMPPCVHEFHISVGEQVRWGERKKHRDESLCIINSSWKSFLYGHKIDFK